MNSLSDIFYPCNYIHTQSCTLQCGAKILFEFVNILTVISQDIKNMADFEIVLY